MQHAVNEVLLLLYSYVILVLDRKWVHVQWSGSASFYWAALTACPAKLVTVGQSQHRSDDHSLSISLAHSVRDPFELIAVHYISK